MAGIFDNFSFINIASEFKKPTLKADLRYFIVAPPSLSYSYFEILNNFVGDKDPNDIEFKISLTNHAFIRQFLSNLNAIKFTGLDNIGPRILKMPADSLAPSLLFIVNKSITSGKFLSVWKEAKVKPLFKAGSKEDVNNCNVSHQANKPRRWKSMLTHQGWFNLLIYATFTRTTNY